jgi:hypothetical protein
MNVDIMKLQFQQSTTIYGSKLDHIWSNGPCEQCILRTTKAFWTDHKPIDFSFKLPNHVTRFHCS